MSGDRKEYKSIGEIRSAFYPDSAAMLDLEREDVLEFPITVEKALQGAETSSKRVHADTDSGQN